MKRYLVDSDVLIDFFNQREDTLALIKHIKETNNMYISILSITELMSGWDNVKASFYLDKLYRLFKIESINLKIVELAGMWRYRYGKGGIKIATVDSVIGATAYLGGFELVTRNIKDFPMPELNLYKHG